MRYKTDEQLLTLLKTQYVNRVVNISGLCYDITDLLCDSQITEDECNTLINLIYSNYEVAVSKFNGRTFINNDGTMPNDIYKDRYWWDTK